MILRLACRMRGHDFIRWSETLSNDPRGNFRVCLRCGKWEFKGKEQSRRG